MNALRFILKYIKYYMFAQTKHDVHSPFVFDLITNLIENETPFYAYDNIESVRSQLLLDNSSVNIIDYGAGSQINKNKKQKVKALAKNSAKPAKYGQLLFRLVNRFQPKQMLEMGTSLGVSTIYQAAASSKAQFISLEGNPEIAAYAKKNLEKLRLKNVEILVGEFSTTLPEALEKLKSLDYVFFDGNHRKEPTLDYFKACLPLAHNNSLFIFDDIHWSKGMEEAWEEIKNHPDVQVTIDLFFIGLVFFRKEQPKQHFTIRF